MPWTASTTRSSRVAERPAIARVGRRWLLALGLGLAAGSTQAAFVVESAETRVLDDVVMLDAKVDFDFSPDAIEAMTNAVPLTVAVEVQVRRVGTFFSRQVAEVRLRYRVETHPLSERYIVTQLNSGNAQTYRSYAAMRAALGNVSDVPLIDRHLLAPGAKYRLRLRAALEVEALPSPLRPLAYVSGPWQLTSDWTESPLVP